LQDASRRLATATADAAAAARQHEAQAGQLDYGRQVAKGRALGLAESLAATDARLGAARAALRARPCRAPLSDRARGDSAHTRSRATSAAGARASPPAPSGSAPHVPAHTPDKGARTCQGHMVLALAATAALQRRVEASAGARRELQAEIGTLAGDLLMVEVGLGALAGGRAAQAGARPVQPGLFADRSPRPAWLAEGAAATGEDGDECDARSVCSSISLSCGTPPTSSHVFGTAATAVKCLQPGIPCQCHSIGLLHEKENTDGLMQPR